MYITQKVEVSLVEFYKLFFNHSLNSQIEVGRHGGEAWDEVHAYLEAVDTYNGFDQYQIKKALYEIDEVIPKVYYNEGNPNNGKRAYSFALGRESSPVIYLKFFAMENVVNETVAKMKVIQDIAETLGACDEFDYEVKEESCLKGYKSLEIRMWWD